ncbi:MAG: SAM-dependent methyltransferase [Chloroflexota bacterium]
MNTIIERKKKIEYGDFQTPKELADLVCQKLVEIGVSPDIIIEPTCGLGAFFESAAIKFSGAKKIIGIEINDDYLSELSVRSRSFLNPERLEARNGDFFKFDWNGLLKGLDGEILVLGNFPWVTNAKQGAIGGLNLPDKTNFQNYNGFDAMTGKSNFDISEFMLIKVADWFQKRNGYLAMLVKTSVARKFIGHLHKTNIGLNYSAIYKIDAMKHFGAAVDACLLYCHFDTSSHTYDYEIYATLSSQTYYRVGHRHGLTVKNLDIFEKLGHLLGHSDEKWRSGVKHDCSEVMELTEKDGKLFNGLGELVDIEDAFIYPLIKGSDVANDRVSQTQRFMIVTQKAVGEATKPIKLIAPKTWGYLESHAKYLDARKSKIYKSNPRFSIFGVGVYTFSSWKIAICGLYKNLNFRLIAQIQNKPVVFDDTVYFLSFDSYDEAKNVLDFLYEQDTQDFLSALIFWDDKRPIKTGILNSLKLNTQSSLVQQPELF